jgi:hypothetical protein
MPFKLFGEWADAQEQTAELQQLNVSFFDDHSPLNRIWNELLEATRIGDEVLAESSIGELLELERQI